jgi:hypothetical protein
MRVTCSLCAAIKVVVLNAGCIQGRCKCQCVGAVPRAPACGVARHQPTQRPGHRLVAKAQANQRLACGVQGADEIQQLTHPRQVSSLTEAGLPVMT